MSRDVMINVENVKKRYRLGEIGGTTLQHELQSWWAAKTGRDDPNQKIGGAVRGSNEIFYALKGVTFRIMKGETIGIIGSNGAGKSTLLKILSRVTAPTEGKVELYGRITSMLEVGTGFDGELTGRDNIYMNGAILGMSRAEINAKMEEIIDFSEVRDFIDTPVKRYSSGMYTKLGFSVASHLDSEIMIMDEVLAVGDAAFQNKCITRMREAAREEGRTVLYVSHNMNQIRQLCDRCIVLNKGEIIFDGDTEGAIARYLQRFSEDKPYADYTGIIRPWWLNTHVLRMESAEYAGNESIRFSGAEPIRLRMKLRAYEDIENLGLRVEISSANDVRIGTYFFYDMCSMKAGDVNEITLEMDISSFTDGTYQTIYTFFNTDQAGTNINLDSVNGLSFIHSESLPASRIHWEAVWGHLALEGGKVLEVKKQ
ncbi:MAG: ATP-binding cassette domain-containing protein [Solobacterium sp.]|nr:ATP-binding cassette domain-containing protein [Solobacterium sp.]